MLALCQRRRPPGSRPPHTSRKRWRLLIAPRAIDDDAQARERRADGADASTTSTATPPTRLLPRWRPWPAFRLAAQALAVTLPLGAGGVDLVGRALFSTPAPALTPDQLGCAAAATEGLTLAAVVFLFRAAAARPEGGVRLPAYDTTSLETVLFSVAGAVGGALAAAACSAAWDAAVGAPSTVGVSASTAEVGQLLASASPPGAAALVAASAVGAPAVEELLYRGLVLPALLDRVLAPPAAIAASAAAFAASHAPTGAPPSDLAALFGLGAALGATAVVAGRGRHHPVDLAAPTLAHALYNAGLLAAAVVASGSGG